MDEQEAEEGIYRVWEGEQETGVEETEGHVVDSGRREEGGQASARARSRRQHNNTAAASTESVTVTAAFSSSSFSAILNSVGVDPQKF